MKVTNPKIFGLILAGGYSRRMGRDKALIEFHGLPQVEYAFNLLQSFCKAVYLSKRPDQPSYKNFAFINDHPEFANRGPLAGILSAMKEDSQADWIVLACDLPFVNQETIKALTEHRDPKKIATAFISAHDRLPEPLCAIWEAHAYPSVLEMFNHGIHCPRKVLIKGDTHLIKASNPQWLENINTPEDLNKL